MKKSERRIVATAHKKTVKHLKQQRDDAIEDAKDWKAEALKWKAQARSSLSLRDEVPQPDLKGCIAENRRLKDIIKRASTKFCENGSDGEIASAMFSILCETGHNNRPKITP